MLQRNHSFQGHARLQRGGTIVGFIVGVLVGLGIAFGVSAYISGLPVPLLNDSNSRLGSNSDERHHNWDPNAPLYSGAELDKPKPKPSTAAVSPVSPASSADTPSGDENATTTATPAPPSAVQVEEGSTVSPLSPAPATASTSSPAPADAAPTTGQTGYFVQAGAFRKRSDADAQRARIGLLGLEARVTEREQNGRIIYRVRVGPFAQREPAQNTLQSLNAEGIDAAIIRLQ